jgi:hypothetical protein
MRRREIDMQPSPHTYQYPKVTPVAQSGAPKPTATPAAPDASHRPQA